MPVAGEGVGLVIRPMYDTQGRPKTLRLAVTRDGAVVKEVDVTAAGDDVSIRPEAAGTYEVSLASSTGRAWQRATISVVDERPKTLLDRLVQQLDEADVETPAADMLRSRLSLLRSPTDPARPPSLVESPFSLSRSLPRETAAVIAGENPYVGKAGTYWTMLAGVPCVVHVPDAVVRHDRPVPLVVALHGAGANENMFVLGYGDGKLRRLADRHRFVLIAARTYPLIGRGDLAAGMVEAASGLYPIDRDRVYGIGHSLGAITLAGWTLGDPDGPAHEAFAAVALIAGGGRPAQVRAAIPTLVQAAGRDRIFRIERLREIVEAVEELGVRASFQLYDDEAHVSIVQRSVSDAVDWLLMQRRGNE